ncbi:MAG TPA: IS110 family transposase [Patescibacteria group bacterium]|nr:IS110 family transposase [Patescibacteria group bacterium]
MEVVYACCAGLDVHKATVVACGRVPGPRPGERRGETKTFATTTGGLAELGDWLRGHGVTEVAMESTGVYWRPVYAGLETRVRVMLVNARHVKMVPGRKTDVRDCEWLAQLLECGLLRASFVPPRAVRDLRDLTRLRKALIRERGHHVKRIEKTLELAQIKLGCVVTDLMGKTGRAILPALSTGIDDPDQLADYAQGLLRKKRAALREALAGRLTPHYAFLLQQHLALIDTLDAHIATLDARIDEAMRPFADAAALVQTMPGVAIRAAQAILAETGMDMVAFPTSAHFASWARLCPGNHESAGKRQPVSTGQGATWLRATRQESAWAAIRTKKSYYRALYHRLKGRGGAKKAVVAVQHAMLIALWPMLKHRVPHADLGADYFDRRNTERARRHHVRRLERLGYNVVLVESVA